MGIEIEKKENDIKLENKFAQHTREVMEPYLYDIVLQTYPEAEIIKQRFDLDVLYRGGGANYVNWIHHDVIFWYDVIENPVEHAMETMNHKDVKKKSEYKIVVTNFWFVFNENEIKNDPLAFFATSEANALNKDNRETNLNLDSCEVNNMLTAKIMQNINRDKCYMFTGSS